jgi:hypothetical protein
LIFLVADERDAILRRTKHGRGQEALLYRFNVDPEELRAAFLDYAAAINSLYETPRWYHGLCANCTTSFYRLPGSRVRCDWRVIANGRLDRVLYQDGRLERTLPFAELRRLAYLNEIANSAPAAGIGDHIRPPWRGQETARANANGEQAARASSRTTLTGQLTTCQGAGHTYPR